MSARPRVAAAILAGGLGTRLGGDVPKPFLPVLGHPLIHYSMRIFESLPEVTRDPRGRARDARGHAWSGSWRPTPSAPTGAGPPVARPERTPPSPPSGRSRETAPTWSSCTTPRAPS